MPFGFKNVGTTYQRLVNRMFKEQIGKMVEVYVNDMIVKSEKQNNHVRDLEEALGMLDKFSMKLNPEKCVFEVRVGKFLGFMISQRGIKANLEKI